MAEEDVEPLIKILEGGIVVDPDLAKSHSCVCVKINDKSEICWNAGIIGALSREQRGPVGQPGPYCPVKIYKESPKIEERIQKFREAVESVKGLTGAERWKKLGEELRARGIEI
jgi:hypothetical protein